MNKIRAIREARGMTCKEVGAKIGATEMSVSRYERDENRLKVAILRKMALALGATVSQLLGEAPFDRTLTARAEGVEIDRDTLERVMGMVDSHLSQKSIELQPEARAGLYLRVHDFARDLPTEIDKAMVDRLVTAMLRK